MSDVLYGDNKPVMKATNEVLIPVDDYAKAVMAIQKLEDIRRIAFSVNPFDTNSGSADCKAAVKAIRAITEKEEDG